MATNLTSQQIEQLKQKGISLEMIDNQLSMFKQGTKYMNIARPARLVDGIMHLSDEEYQMYLEKYDDAIDTKEVCKFIPASGAATRMFKDLYAYLDSGEISAFVETFFTNIEKFAFYNELKQMLQDNGENLDVLLDQKEYKTILEFFLTDKGLAYGSLPKGLLSFHLKGEKPQTPIAEHVKEAKAYAGDNAKLSFTISEQFHDRFVKEIEACLEQEGAKAMSYDISYQKPETDTVAVDKNFQPFVLDNGDLLMRPGGHGSLVANLNDIDADIIFVKNIDNVCSEKYLKSTVDNKKVLAGVLLDLQEKAFDYIKKIENYDGEDDRFNFELRDFLEQELGILSKQLCRSEAEDKVSYFKEILSRPIRVCGMVRNEGEPGGGPFWIRVEPWLLNLQIVESSQVKFEDKTQNVMFKESSHFNPVDIVCGVRDVNGNKYDLEKFVDKDAIFIAEKSHQGKDILALEHPGLWNGGMANWTTVFVEVPLKTFNPVKTINDLLRKEHQNE
jgi:hypothetical protein